MIPHQFHFVPEGGLLLVSCNLNSYALKQFLTNISLVPVLFITLIANNSCKYDIFQVEKFSLVTSMELLSDISLLVLPQNFCLGHVFYFPKHEYVLQCLHQIYNTNTWAFCWWMTGFFKKLEFLQEWDYLPCLLVLVIYPMSWNNATLKFDFTGLRK